MLLEVGSADSDLDSRAHQFFVTTLVDSLESLQYVADNHPVDHL